MKPKKRKCLVCDQDFVSVKNRICKKCHRSHAVSFQSGSFTGNWTSLIYLESDVEDDDEKEANGK